MAAKPNQIIGSFVFRNEGDGCLTSKYHHADSTNGAYTEACKLLREDPLHPLDRFAGTYRTAWIEEPDNSAESTELLIRLKTHHIYELFWYNPPFTNSADAVFEGTAMLYGDLLTGAYRD